MKKVGLWQSYFKITICHPFIQVVSCKKRRETISRTKVSEFSLQPKLRHNGELVSSCDILAQNK